MSYSPRLIDRGEQAVKIAAEILSTAREHTLPDGSRLIPGSIWSGDRMLISAAELEIYYIVKDQLFEWTGASTFIRDELLNAYGEGARRAEGMVILNKTIIGFLTGVFVPFYVILGLHMAATGLFYLKYENLIKETFHKAESVKRNYDEFQSYYPKTTEIMKRKLKNFILVNLPSGITIALVALFIGRMIRAYSVSRTALGTLLRIIITFVGLSAIHITPVAFRGAQTGLGAAQPHITDIANDQVINERDIILLQQRFNEIGITLSNKEVIEIIQELRSQKDTAKRLYEFSKSIEELIPLLDKLISVYPYLK